MSPDFGETPVALIGDNDPDIWDLYLGILGRYGYKVDCYDDPQALFEVLVNSPQGVRFVITDYDYGQDGWNGLTLVRKIREYPDPNISPISILMISGTKLSHEEMAEIGAWGVTRIAKPFEINNVVKWVESFPGG